ncbi:MAG TPA: GAF domain-containing SpoIIE family protein phosphatase [Frankiaceae bacterium]|nr:GAF domain-containing SpoIIE family protein phosphatase [Frankiaceae bacterium]
MLAPIARGDYLRTVNSATPRDMSQEFAVVARTLQVEGTAQRTLQKIVDLAPLTIEGCAYAGVTMVARRQVETPAASNHIPRVVDRLQDETGQGPCLDAIRHHEVFVTDDLLEERRWPQFSRRAVEETGVRSILSLRLFVDEDTIGALNLYSREPAAFGPISRASGAVFAAHAAVALTSAREHDRAQLLQQDLTSTVESVQSYEQQVEIGAAIQRSMLPPLPDLGRFQLTARYKPAAAAAQVGGDWYDAFPIRDGVTALVIGDVAGHDIDAAVRMGQLRNLLRALAVDRDESPGDLLSRLDRAATHLQATDTVTCIYALLEERGAAPPRLHFANGGHPPPLLMTVAGSAEYLDTPAHTLLGLGVDLQRSTTVIDLPARSTLLLYTDGLVEHRGRSIDDGMDQLRELGTTLTTHSLESICDTLIGELAAQPRDDVCLLALRTPDLIPSPRGT